MTNRHASQTAYDEALAQRLATLLLAAWHAASPAQEDVADPRVDGDIIDQTPADLERFSETSTEAKVTR